MWLLLALTRYWPTRHLLWWSSRLLGRVRTWVTSGWRRPAVVLGALAGAAYLAEELLGRARGTWFSFWKLAAVYVLGAFVVALWRSRTRVVAERFVDQTGDEERPDSHGIGARLIGRLASHRELYAAVDEKRLPGAVAVGKPMHATVQLDDVSDFLRNAASADSRVSVGPIAIPIGTVLALFGRLVQGPRLLGSLYTDRLPDGTRVFVLEAQLIGTGIGQSWRTKRASSDAGEAPPLDDMIDELACRIFASLALPGDARWRGTHHFLEALKSIRACLQTPRERKLRLREAERSLIRAISEDQSQPFAYYNLGAVHNELRRYGSPGEAEASAAAAERAFLTQISLLPGRWQPYYALAESYYQQERNIDVTALCDRVIELKPGTMGLAKAYLLKGLAEKGMPDLHDQRRRVCKSLRYATAYAWWSLCRCEFAAGSKEEAQTAAAVSLINLAEAVAASPRPHEARRIRQGRRRRLIRDASAVSTSFSGPLLDLAYLEVERGDLKAAVDAYKAALRINPQTGQTWAELGVVDCRLQREAQASGDPVAARNWGALAFRAVGRALAHVDARDVGAEPTLATASWILGELDLPRSREVAERGVFVRSLEPMDKDELEAELERCEREGLTWEAGCVGINLGRLLLHSDPHGATEHLERALEHLERDPEETRRQGARALYAQALAKCGRFADALGEARNALGSDPLSWYERDKLAEVYLELKDYDGARLAWESALLCDPDQPSVYWKLGNCYRNLADERVDRAARQEALELAAHYLLLSLDVFGPTDLVPAFRSRYWLGRIYAALGRYDQVLPHLRRAVALESTRPLVKLLLGEAFQRGKNYELAEDILREAVQETEARIGDGKPTETIGDEFEDAWSPALVLAWSHCWLAYTYVDRNVRLDEALEHVQTARSAVADDGGVENYPSCEAACLQLEGLVALAHDDVDGAIAKLGASLAVFPDSEVYSDLGSAYLAKARQTKAKREREKSIQQARRACELAEKLDVTGDVTAEVGPLLAALESDGLVLASTSTTTTAPVPPVSVDGR
jgi:tetratricopeptide (TPR) repeat protein